MSLLGDFLESFYGDGNEFKTVHARVRHEQQEVPGAIGRRQAIGKVKQSKAVLKTEKADMEFWAVLPDSVRVDMTRTEDGQTKTKVEICSGAEILKRNPDGSVEVEKEAKRMKGIGNSFPTEFRRHFDRTLIREFFNSLTLQQIGACQIAGRDCVRIRAVQLPDTQIWPHWLPSTADEFEFAADIAQPSLLSIKGLNSGQMIESYEVLELAFDQPIDKTMFTCEPLSGQTIRPAVPIVERMSIEAAAERVPFPILLPIEWMNGRAGLPEIMYHPPRGHSDENLTVYHSGNPSNQLWVGLQAHPNIAEDEKLEWERVDAAERSFQLSDPDLLDGLTILAFDQDGTHVRIMSDLPRSELLDFALSFRPYRVKPP